MLDTRFRRSPCTSVISADDNNIRCTFCNSRCYRPNTRFGDNGHNEGIFEYNIIEGGDINVENEVDYFTLILGLATMSSYLKSIVQSLLETHYPDLDAERLQRELEEKESIKRQRSELKAEVKAKKAEVREVKRKDKKSAKEGTDLE